MSGAIQSLAVASTRAARPKRLRWGWLEWFIVIQFLSPGLLFLPGAQSIRFIVRTLPYLSSLALLIHFSWGARKREIPAAGKWLVGVMVVLTVSLFHPGTKVSAGVAQWVFQLAVMAPLFWVGRTIDSEARLVRLIWLIFLTNAVSSTLGILQVFVPGIFMPPELSRLGMELSPNFTGTGVGSFISASGQEVIKPPGLSDLPGGAAVAAAITIIMGIAFALRPSQRLPLRVLSILLATIAVGTLYFTLVRSLAIMALIALIAMFALTLRQGQLAVSIRMLVSGAALVAGAIAFGSVIGGEFYGESLMSRFAIIFETGIFTSWQNERGFFLTHTMEVLLPKFPLGAGAGRWGMMQVYFGDKTGLQYPPIHAEIQITGWLLDGGVLMWIAYISAIVSAVWYTAVRAMSRALTPIPYAAAMIFCIQLLILGTAWAGPAFNTQLGILFWTLSGALHGADLAGRRRARLARAATPWVNPTGGFLSSSEAPR